MRRFASPRYLRSAVPGVVLLLLAVASAGCGPEPPRPNIVLVSLDTLRPDHLGIYGYDRDTSPNMDEWARRGIVFRNHYAQAPNTAPSHTSLLTGLFPSVAGIWDHGAVLDPNVPLLAELFKEAGYSTAAFVQLPGESYKRGFDLYTVSTHKASMRRGANSNADELFDFIGAQSEAPFFLFIHTYAVHMPYHPRPEVGERFWGDYDGEIGRNIRGVIIDGINDGTRDYTDADVQHIIDMYDAEIATVDVDMGQILGFFAEQGLIDNTIFAIVSDHGEEFGEHGMVGRHSYSLHEQLIRTPLIMFGGGLPAGVDVELPSRNVDVAPTLLEFARIDVPSRMQGFDLAPLWEGTEREPRVILAEKRRYRVFIVDGFKYNTKTGELFDLRADSLERNDLRDQMPDKIVAFERLIAGWEAELARAQATVAEAGDVQLTPAEINRLKALGYLR